METLNSHISAHEVWKALERLLQKHEQYELEDDLVVKESITRTGGKLYVIRALNGAEAAVKSELATVSGSRAYCGAGTWVLRAAEISALFKKASL